jgi:hypothetical protein
MGSCNVKRKEDIFKKYITGRTFTYGRKEFKCRNKMRAGRLSSRKWRAKRGSYHSEYNI